MVSDIERNSIKSKALRFSVDSQLLGELGEKLVTNNYVALAELIKNSYDADATNVTIKLINALKQSSHDGQSEIHIIDTGVGMTFTEISANWMRIASANKLDDPISRIYGRSKTGNKGVGRFACQRLARYLELESTAKTGSGFEHTRVRFDWNDFIPGTTVTEIPCEFTTKRTKTGKPGLILKLKELRELWLKRDFTMLQRSVSLLSLAAPQKREGYKEDKGFNITIEAPEFDEVHKPLGRKYLESGWGSLKGKVLADGTVRLNLKAKGIKSLDYTLPKTFDLLPKTSFELHYLPYYTKQYENRRDKTLLTQKVHKELMTQQSGIRVYHNNFRIYPYGEEGDDWLGIDRDTSRRMGEVKDDALKELSRRLLLNPSRVLLNYPGNRNLIGSIYLSNDNKLFVPKMDREGLVETEAVDSLRKVIRLSLDWLTIQFESEKNKAKKAERERREKEFKNSIASDNLPPQETISKAIEYVTHYVETSANDTGGEKKVASEKNSIDNPKKRLETAIDATEYIRSRIDEQESELTLLRAVASTGPLMFIFAHEVKGVTAKLDTEAAYIERVAKKIDSKNKEIAKSLSNIADSFRMTKRRFNQLDSLFNVFGSSQRLKNKRILIKNNIEKVIEGFGFVLNEYNIETKITVDSPLLKTQSMNEAEFFSIVVNLLSNSIKASIVGRNRKIHIAASKDSDSDKINIVFKDQGIGLSKEYWEHVFTPTVIDPENLIYDKLQIKLRDENLSVLGKGTGLGLSIVRSIVESKSGTVSFFSPPKGWSTAIMVTI